MSESVSEAASGSLLHNLLLFGRLLRRLGLDVNPGRTIDLVTALRFVSIGQRSDFYHAARGLMVHRREDIPRFDQAFDLFWRRRGKKTPALDMQSQVRKFRAPRGKAAAPEITVPSLDERAAGAGDADSSSEQVSANRATLTYSEQEILRQKDFAELTPAELDAVKSLISDIAWRIGARKTRRRKPGHGRLLDLRRTVRLNLRYGGEVLDWAEREPKVKPPPLVIIADVSGSMERYTRLLLLFTYGLARALNQKVEAFVFSTRLTRISRQLRARNLDRALRDVALAVPDWSGGTRIGEALRTFNFDWGRRVLGRGALTLVISDGWDCGDITLLGTEISRLQRSSRRLIWLNPLLGAPDYEPLTRGIKAALPYIDDFLPVHNLVSLDDLAAHLAGLYKQRPTRRQRGVRRG